MSRKNEKPITHLPAEYTFNESETELFNSNIGLVGRMISGRKGDAGRRTIGAKKLVRCLMAVGYSEDEIYQVGCYGLLSACRDGMYKKDISAFSTYACNCIYRALLREVQQQNTQRARNRPTPNSEVVDDYFNEKMKPRIMSEYLGIEEVQEAIDSMPEGKIKEVLIAYFCLDGSDFQPTFADLSSRFGVVRECVRQWLQKGLTQLREKLNVCNVATGS